MSVIKISFYNDRESNSFKTYKFKILYSIDTLKYSPSSICPSNSHNKLSPPFTLLRLFPTMLH